jgi:hypothetical protein
MKKTEGRKSRDRVPLSKFESLCHADSKHIFILKIARVLSEKNIFKLDAAFQFLRLRPVFPSILTLCVIYDMKMAILRKTP